MKIIKKIPVNWKSLVDDIENPTFIYFADKSNIYDYHNKKLKVYTNAQYKYGTGKGYFELQESGYTYVIRMKFRICSTTYKGFFLIEEKDNKNYLQEYYDGLRNDTSAMPKMSPSDFYQFFEYVQDGIIKPENGYFDCNLRLTKKASQYFLKFLVEDNKQFQNG